MSAFVVGSRFQFLLFSGDTIVKLIKRAFNVQLTLRYARVTFVMRLFKSSQLVLSSLFHGKSVSFQVTLNSFSFVFSVVSPNPYCKMNTNYTIFLIECVLMLSSYVPQYKVVPLQLQGLVSDENDFVMT